MTENGWDEHFADDRSRLGQRVTRSGLKNVSPSQPNNILRHSILRVSENMRAKKVRFYRNGDRFFKGMLYAVSPERFRTFESLLAELTMSPLCDKNVLPQGVRYIFSADTAKIITTLDQLEEGESYVCASNDMFRDIDYEKSSNPNWNVNVKTRENQDLAGNSGRDVTDDDKSFVKPKLVTIIRNGTKPRKAVRILLNKKTAHSFSQVLDDITDAIKLDSGTVKKIYTVDGRQVTCLSDFFQDETIFIAYGAEKCSMDDFDLDQKEVRLVSGYKASLSQSRERITLRSPKSPRKSSSSRSLHEVGLESPSRSRNSSPKSPRKLRTVSAPKYRNGVSNGSSSLPNSPKPARRSTAGKTRLPDELTERYDIGMVIGEGNFAVVKECVDRFNNRRFALKIIDKSRCKGKEEEMLENEVSILRKVKHPNIILLVEEYDTRDSLFMVMELVKGGDLFDAIAASTKYTERDASGMVYNLACALKYLHSLNIVHRDIKPENLLVCDHGDDSKSLKLGDFGLATVVSDTLYTVCGTPTYVAPEVLAESGYGLKIDVWSTGVITYILLCGFPPFYSAKDNQEELFDHILEGKFNFTEPYWNDVSESAKELISNMLVVDPDDRFNAEQVLQHPWVASDTARDENIHDNITEKLNSHFDHKAKRKPKDSAGIRLITSTALDKGSRYFQGRGGATFTLHARGNNSDSEDEDEIF